MKYDEITRQANDAIRELLAIAKLEKGDILSYWQYPHVRKARRRTGAYNLRDYHRRA